MQSGLHGIGRVGAEPTVRFGTFAEGIQTREAIHFLQRTVADGAVTGDLAKRCNDLIREGGHNQVGPVGQRHWLRDEHRLLALCAETVKALEEN